MQSYIPRSSNIRPGFEWWGSSLALLILRADEQQAANQRRVLGGGDRLQPEASESRAEGAAETDGNQATSAGGFCVTRSTAPMSAQCPCLALKCPNRGRRSAVGPSVNQSIKLFNNRFPSSKSWPGPTPLL
jgi:hypothetical protein